MITFTITGDNVPVTDQVRDYVEKRFGSFDRFVGENHAPEISVTLSKTTAHQREDTMRVEVKFKLHPREFFVVGEASDVMAAIDQAKEELMREVTHNKAKRQSLFHRGARKLKKLMKAGFPKKD